LQNYAPAFRGEDILITQGDDFNYMAASMYVERLRH